MCYPLFIVWETHVLFISISSETVEFHICMWSKLNILEKSHTGLFLSLLFFFFLNWTLSHPLLISLLHCHLLKPVRHGFSSPDMFTFRSVTGLNYYNFLNIRTSVSTTKVGCKFLLLFMLLLFFFHSLQRFCLTQQYTAQCWTTALIGRHLAFSRGFSYCSLKFLQHQALLY